MARLHIALAVLSCVPALAEPEGGCACYYGGKEHDCNPSPFKGDNRCVCGPKQSDWKTPAECKPPSPPVLAATYDPVITFENNAGNSVMLMQECNEVFTVGAGEQAVQVPIPKTGAKFWIKPQGFKYDCKQDCLDCFYISAGVAPSGALVTGIGYGHNTPVKVHDGVASIELDATREDTKKPDEVKCSTSSCNFNHVIPGFNTRITMSGPSDSVLALPAGWTHIGPGQSLPGKGSGDCTGCKLPVQTRSDPKIKFQDCVDWFNKDCPNDQWPGESKQPKGCFKGTNALSLDVGWQGKPAEGMCRAWVCPGTPGVNKWAQWDCYYKASLQANSTTILV